MTDELQKIPAIAKEIVKNKRTGKVYDSKADFDSDVSNPDTDTTNDDFQQDLQVTVASLHTKGETIPD
jgi:tRNA U54 and U55 pseudouridine synthase Pus10